MTLTPMLRSAPGGAVAITMLAALGLLAGAFSAQTVRDDALRERIEAVLERASDLPADSIRVTVTDGVVTLEGSVVCPDCGGVSTPGGTGTVQQSLGAVVRAIPGVDRVVFELVYSAET